MVALAATRCSLFMAPATYEISRRWSSGNITLLGDACHPATPNNGQGACMAIEDAFVLATLLAEYWEEPDGHIEAFYLYEVNGDSLTKTSHPFRESRLTFVIVYSRYYVHNCGLGLIHCSALYSTSCGLSVLKNKHNPAKCITH